jgi:hypothetical protein
MNNHQMKELSSAERFHAIMEDLGFKKHLSPAVLAAALDLHEGRLPRPDLLNEARNFFATRAIFVPHGLEGLPSIWLSRLSEILWSTRKPEWEFLPYFITSIGVEGGILRIGYPREQWVLGDRITLWDQLRVVVNLSLQPNQWHPLSLTDEREIWEKRPDLRRELLALG